MALITVIIPTCNRYNLLKRAVLSVLYQDFPSIDIIIIDDTEEPSLPQYIDTFFQENNIKYIVNTGKHGPSYSRNLGILSSESEYVTFLDDDDIYLPGRLISMYEKIISNDYSFISSGRIFEISNLKKIIFDKNQKFGRIDLDSVMYGNTIDIGLMVKKETLLKVGLFDTSLKSHEDWDLVIKLCCIKPGFKIKRFDYLVNSDFSRPRITHFSHDGYRQVANKYKSLFGVKWANTIQMKSYLYKDKLNLREVILLVIQYKSLIPMFILVKRVALEILRK